MTFWMDLNWQGHHDPVTSLICFKIFLIDSSLDCEFRGPIDNIRCSNTAKKKSNSPFNFSNYDSVAPWLKQLPTAFGIFQFTPHQSPFAGPYPRYLVSNIRQVIYKKIAEDY